MPEGGPSRVEVKSRGLDIGRDSRLDWTLPDPNRYVSGKHCEIRFRDGGYWLRDVSMNGTFVNGAKFRLDAPHLLRNGDRLTIGPYLVAVEIEGEAAAPGHSLGAALPERAAGGRDLWGAGGETAAPDDRRDHRPAKARADPVDFLGFAGPPSDVGPDSDIFAAPTQPEDTRLSAIPATPASAPRAAVEQPTRRRAAPVPPPSAEIEPPPRPAIVEPPPLAPIPPPPAEAAAIPVSDIIARIAAAAGIPERALSGRDPLALADEIGAVIRLATQNLAQLLNSRAETKTLIRSSSRTMIRAFENNPLKFATSPEEALAIMFGPPTRNYLDARGTVEGSFADIKDHQVLTFGAMQGALEGLFEDLAPEKIDRSVEPDKGLGALLGSRKAKLWDLYVERWRAKTKRADGRLNEAFMALFAEAYDRLRNKNG